MAAGYLSAASIEKCLVFLSQAYPTLCQLIILPDQTHEGRTSRAIKIAKGSGTSRRGVLFIAGVHAREIVNPDLLVTLAFRLLNAYQNNAGLSFGPRTYSASVVKMIVENLDLFIFPLVNPDGRVYVQTPPPGGDQWWRKNRRINAGNACRGVDINRNYDFLWNSGIGTSASPCSDSYKGPSAFSEPETRNVRYLLDTYRNIGSMVDVHSQSELILHPWGDDEVQTTDPSQNFQNPVYDGLRGVVGSGYKEYMDPDDLDSFVYLGEQMRDAISAVRGRVYTVEQAIYLYPTSGTSKDYAFSRHLVNASKKKVYAYTVETGTQFQPEHSEGQNVMEEVSSGLVQFCLNSLCLVEATAAGTALASQLDDLRKFRDADMKGIPNGEKYIRYLERHSAEILEKLAADPKLKAQAFEVLQEVQDVIGSRNKAKPKAFSPALVTKIDSMAGQFAKSASPEFKKALAVVQEDVKTFSGKTVQESLKVRKTKKVKA